MKEKEISNKDKIIIGKENEIVNILKGILSNGYTLTKDILIQLKS